MASMETRLHSGEGTVGFEMVGGLFIYLAFVDFRGWMTAAAFQSLRISADTKERLNRVVIGVAKMAADNLR